MSAEPLTTEAKLRAVLAKYRCGDTGCIFGRAGQGTNGGCRCFSIASGQRAMAFAGRFMEFVRDVREVLR